MLPTTPYDAKGLLTAAIRDDNPVVFLEHRWLYWAVDEVPEEPYEIPLGTSNILREGSRLTLVGTSWMNVECLRAADVLAKRGVEVEVVDVRTIAPFDETLIVESVRKTGRCLVTDNDWSHSGFNAEVVSRVSEQCSGQLKSPVKRIGFAPTPCPTVRSLENEFYPNAENIIRAVEAELDLSPTDLSAEDSSVTSGDSRVHSSLSRKLKPAFRNCLFPEASDGMCEDLPATCSPAAAWIPSKFVPPSFAR